MKNFIFILLSVFAFNAYSETINVNWLNEDNTTYSTSTCTIGGDLNIPETPTKRGYTFVGWIPAATRIEYIQIGSGQCINTGFTASSNTKFRIKLNMQKETGGAIVRFNWDTRFFNYSQQIYFDWNKDRRTGISRSFANNKTYDFLGGAWYVKDYANPDVNLVGNVEIRTLNNPSEVIVFDGMSEGKLYLFQLWDNDTLVRDMVPVIDHNGRPCMYDKITNTFFYNVCENGRLDFVAGPVITEEN